MAAMTQIMTRPDRTGPSLAPILVFGQLLVNDLNRGVSVVVIVLLSG